MKLTLKNFKCYSDKTFHFEDDNVTLISGPSGRGKTTILLAIQFALHGSLSHKYLVSYGSLSCQVELEYKNFKIKRTKRPNILTVVVSGDNPNVYEDKDAQVVINKHFGISNPFVFMDLSHLEKVAFLEKLANSDCDVNDLKKKIKLEISDISRNMTTVEGKIFGNS